MSNHTQLTVLLLAVTLYGAPVLSAAPLDDPMRPPSKELVSSSTGNGSGKSAPLSAKSGYHLSAIRIAKEHRSATVNNKRVAVGERIGAARVVAINTTGVTLKQAGKQFTIPLLPHTIIKPVEAKQP